MQTTFILAACIGSFISGWTARRASQARQRRCSSSCHDDPSFHIVPQLSEGKQEVIRLGLSTVLLMDDKRFPWLVLVPRRGNAVEVIDLSAAEQQQLWQEVAQASAIIQKLPGVKKLNVATLGNVCSQLHIHVTGRHPGDAAWPGPCYGVATAECYDKAELQVLLEQLRIAFLRA